jgi:hypothetical protein
MGKLCAYTMISFQKKAFMHKKGKRRRRWDDNISRDLEETG